MGSDVPVINNHGPRAREWVKIRRAWIKANPPNHEGYYVCGICAQSVNISDMELDHINPRSGEPQSFGDHLNLQPTHGFPCNRLKGSRRLKPLVNHAEYELRKELNL